MIILELIFCAYCFCYLTLVLYFSLLLYLSHLQKQTKYRMWLIGLSVETSLDQSKVRFKKSIILFSMILPLDRYIPCSRLFFQIIYFVVLDFYTSVLSLYCDIIIEIVVLKCAYSIIISIVYSMTTMSYYSLLRLMLIRMGESGVGNWKSGYFLKTGWFIFTI